MALENGYYHEYKSNNNRQQRGNDDEYSIFKFNNNCSND